MTPPTDEALRALAHPDRRRLLTALLECEHPTDDAVQALDVVPGARRDPARLSVELYHDHLPRLEDAGFLRWDGESFEVSAGPRFDEVRCALESMEDRPDERAPCE